MDEDRWIFDLHCWNRYSGFLKLKKISIWKFDAWRFLASLLFFRSILCVNSKKPGFLLKKMCTSRNILGIYLTWKMGWREFGKWKSCNSFQKTRDVQKSIRMNQKIFWHFTSSFFAWNFTKVDTIFQESTALFFPQN